MRTFLKPIPFLLVLLFSCVPDVTEYKPDSKYKEAILAHLNLYKQDAQPELVSKIEELALKLDFTAIQHYGLSSGQQVLMAEVKPLTGLEAKKTYAVFTTDLVRIVNAYLVTFQDEGQYDYPMLLKAYM